VLADCPHGQLYRAALSRRNDAVYARSADVILTGRMVAALFVQWTQRSPQVFGIVGTSLFCRPAKHSSCPGRVEGSLSV